MSKLFNSVFDAGKDFIKDAAGELVEQGKETIKSSASDKLNGIINNTIQNMGTRQNSFEEDTNTAKISTSSGNEVMEEVYLDADAFEENLRGNLKGMVSSLAAANPAEAKEVLNSFVTMAGEVTKFTEVQKTKRKEIEAKRDILVNKIQSQKEIILAYLEKSFDERKENFAKLFSIVDSAIVNNNMHQLAMGLDSINKLADSSPFKALASIESTRLALEDKNHEWDI
jgi:hypothetical protein